MNSDRTRGTILPLLFLIGRPAAGKSEVIKYLRETEEADRARRFHIGAFHELDDFPMIWAWFEEDAILAKRGLPRLHTDNDGYFLEKAYWLVLIERLELEYRKWLAEAAPSSSRDDDDTLPPTAAGATAIVEFARGTEHGGLAAAFEAFSATVLERASVLYIDVSYEESLRKNRRRFNPDKPYSILEHALPDDKLERLYRDSDWAALSSADEDFLTVGRARVPYAVFPNSDDVTTRGGEALGERLERVLGTLWQRHRRRGS